MKTQLFALISAAIPGLFLVSAELTAGHAQSDSAVFPRYEEDTFIRLPAMEFTIATLQLDGVVARIPFDFSRSERAFSQIRPSVDYSGGMVWLTFKYGRHRSFLSQLKNLSITKRIKSSYRLASPIKYRFEKISQRRYFNFTSFNQETPRRKPDPHVRAKTSSTPSSGEAAPGDLAVNRHHREP